MINLKYQENRDSNFLKAKVKQVLKLNQDKFGDNREQMYFDEKGNLISHKIFEKDILIVDILNQFSENNQIQKKTDILTGKYWNYEYDAQGALIGIYKYDASNFLEQQIILQYTDRRVRRETVKSENVVCWLYDYEYDASGRIIKETEKRCDNQIEGIVEFVYNEKNEMIKEINYDENQEFSYAVELQYNEYGDQVLSSVNGDFGSETRFEYEYDAHHNWVKQYNLMNNKRKLIYERRIEYYEL